MARKPPPVDPRALKRDEKRLATLAAKPQKPPQPKKGK